MFKVATAALFCCLMTGIASAQIPTSGNVFFGYSYQNSNAVNSGGTGLNGWNGSLEGKIFPFVGIVADLSGNYGSQSVPITSGCTIGVTCLVTSTNASISEYNFLFGPRASVSVGRFRPFVHALFGASHISASGTGVSNSDTSFGDALGGGLDYRLMRLIGARIQVDDLQTRFFGNTQNNLRMSVGLVLRF